MDICPVILAGGTGTRLWPLSREVMPKQFLSFVGENTLFQETVMRATELCAGQAPLVVCNDAHYFYCQDQLNSLNTMGSHFILEPVARDTAGAIALAALYWVAQGKGDVPMLLMPADHDLKDVVHFKACINAAMPHVLAGKLATFGVTPDKPETGYGYIEMGSPITESVCHVTRFVEKPDLSTAEAYLASGQYLWNSGMFLFTANTYLRELEKYHPEVLESAMESLQQTQLGVDFHRIHKASYEACPKISIDYAVMEKSDQVVVVPFDSSWSDLGCWASVFENQLRDGNQNVVVGDVIVERSHNCYFNAQDNRLIAAIGLEDKIVVSTSDAILIADKKYAQEVKGLVQKLKEANHNTATSHKRVFRPWGYYESLAAGPGYQVKHIMVKPGARLSLQTHQRRAEHWVVVSGEATVVNGEQGITLQANQSTYISKGAQHRLSNLKNEPLHVIEVQSGDYLGEDDIVRIHDDYKREFN
ncbi:MAG: mannose-1-phosphate guanylyltransferase/mannose-6-phosphate isomerase [Gammaproteobacteria bacterium]